MQTAAFHRTILVSTLTKPTPWAFLLLIALFLPATIWSQADTASIEGTVLDATGAVVPDAELVLISVATNVERRVTSSRDGLFAFQTLRPGDYELHVTATGFRGLQRSGISLRPNQKVRLDLELEVGAVTETVTVSAAVTPLNFENATQESGVGPNVLNQLPLIVSGSVRNVTQYAMLVPGVNFGGTGSAAFDARVNGGMAGGDEAVLDGATLSGMGGNLGFINFNDMKMTPDMVDEFRMISSNYEPHWGASTSSQIVVKSRSGTSEYHGGLFWYHRNEVLNAAPWGRQRPPNLENNFGGFAGGKVPGLNRGKVKTFFYFLAESYRASGGVNVPTLTIPSLKQRVGDFTDWRAGGNLIPVYDPATTRRNADGAFVRDQFNCMGVANVICPSRVSNSLANQWLQHLPQPTRDGPIQNFVPAKPRPGNAAVQDYQMTRIDFHPGDNDHIGGTYWHRVQPGNDTPFLPEILDGQPLARSFSDMVRINWDHTFRPTLLNTFNYGWTHNSNPSTGGDKNAAEKAAILPKIPGVDNHNAPPWILFTDGFQSFNNRDGGFEPTSLGTFVYNNLTTWVKGKHTFKFGAEHWRIRLNGPAYRGIGSPQGQFRFERGPTSLLGQTSGSPIASFLLEQVSFTKTLFRTIDRTLPQQTSYMAHFGDTWKVTPKFTLSLGVRWDMHKPATEVFDHSSFFDPHKPNPGAGGRLGALAFSGSDAGAASFGARYPEHLFKKGFAPRLGIAYAFNEKTVVRAGYGIYYGQAFYPGWNRGVSQDGFSNDVAFNATDGGLTPAMILSEGFPQNFARPPFIDPSFNNGQEPFYRDFDGNRLSYSQQWNLTVERQLANNTSLSLAYVANKGNRLNTVINPINVIDPKLASMGANVLRAQFQPGQTSLHGVPLPYDGWVEQLGCAPSVAQALLPYPQFCGDLQATNELAGVSTYHSFQLRVEKNFASGTYLLASYTLSKLLTSGGNVNTPFGGTFAGLNGAFSPFERHREKSLANDDVPHNLTVAWVYEMPFGQGKRFNSGSGALNKVIGGWVVSGIYRAVSGVPWWVRSGNCNTLPQFRARCVPALLPGENPFAQSKSDFDPAKGPLFRQDAFEPVSAFNQFGYVGVGDRILPRTRQFGIQNWDVSIYKNTPLTERLNLQLRFEFFNIFNMHDFAGSAVWGGSPFNQSFGSPNFGRWNGTVTNPRNIQVGARLEF